MLSRVQKPMASDDAEMNAQRLSVALAVVLAACGSDVETTPDEGSGGGASTGATATGGANGPTTQSSSGAGDGGGDVAVSVGQGGSAEVSTGAGGGCDAPLPQETIDVLELTGNGAGKLLGSATAHPGDVVQFEIGTMECCYSFEPVAACASFSLDDASPASIDPVSGLVTVSASAPHGSIVNVSANVEDGRRLLEAPLYIWTEEGNPIVGNYTEVAQLDCEQGGEVIPEETIGELHLGADLRFGVTWQPFEVYVDYWGSYTLDAETGSIELTVDGGNYLPDGVDGSGSFTLVDGELVLRDIWLGLPQGAEGEARCGHVFQ